jgi:methanogenesis imperfect marker protein 11
MASMRPEEILERYGSLPFITPYQSIYALTDADGHLVELHEFHARGVCTGGSAWEVFHFARTSPLILEARREGPRNIFVCRAGVTDLDLIPGLASAGLERVNILEDSVELTYAGLAGGGVAATACRGLARGVLGMEVESMGGGAKLGRARLTLPRLRKMVVGLDDTDDKEQGATWAVANEAAWLTGQEGLAVYLYHIINQLFPQNPYRTTNCCSTAVVFGVHEARAEEALGFFLERVRERCYSDEAAAAVMQRIRIPQELIRYTRSVKSRMVEEDETTSMAEWLGIELLPITGRRGMTGALAALGMSDRPDDAVKPYA